MKNTIKLSVAVTMTIAGLAIGIYHYLRERHYDQVVFEIIETPQRYDGSTVDDLVALGPPAVGAIGRALTDGVEFPLVLLTVLDRIGSERGMGALFEFLERQARYAEYDVLTQQAILAFRGVGNRKACEPLRIIFDDDAATPRIRLYAAQSIAHLCASEDARNFILDAYARHDGVNNAGSVQGYTFREVAEALIDVNTGDSEALLLNLVRGGFYSPVMSEAVIEHLSTRGGQDVVDVLLDVTRRKSEFEFPGRLAAVRGLVEMDVLPRNVLLPITEDLAREAEQAFADWEGVSSARRIVDGYLEEARDLKAQVESR